MLKCKEIVPKKIKHFFWLLLLLYICNSNWFIVMGKERKKFSHIYPSLSTWYSDFHRIQTVAVRLICWFTEIRITKFVFLIQNTWSYITLYFITAIFWYNENVDQKNMFTWNSVVFNFSAGGILIQVVIWLP